VESKRSRSYPKLILTSRSIIESMSNRGRVIILRIGSCIFNSFIATSFYTLLVFIIRVTKGPSRFPYINIRGSREALLFVAKESSSSSFISSVTLLIVAYP